MLSENVKPLITDFGFKVMIRDKIEKDYLKIWKKKEDQTKEP